MVGLCAAKKVPFWYYMTRYEGMSEAEAKELETEAAPKDALLFGPEE